ncbi:MAG: type II toxin-antitoxin system RelB/DinJ family antitoxin [Methylococcales bacterium]
MKSATIRARIEPELKANVENILVSLGLNTSDAITIFYKQIELHNGLPFKVEIPNSETRKILDELDRGENLIECKDAQDMFDKLGI